jgi:FKBP-type peptidyl-prolyl cis-trans isomerase (trigger factor)
MINPSSKTVAVQEVIGYLRRDLRLREIYQEIAIQKIIINAAREENQTISDEEIQQEIDTICRNNGIYQPAGEIDDWQVSVPIVFQ